MCLQDRITVNAPVVFTYAFIKSPDICLLLIYECMYWTLYGHYARASGKGLELNEIRLMLNVVCIGMSLQ